jgi:hypothetical protein
LYESCVYSTKTYQYYACKGMQQAADILEKYGIGRETDLSELEQDDFSELDDLHPRAWVHRSSSAGVKLYMHCCDKEISFNFQHSRTCFVQCSLTHPTLARPTLALSVSLAFSMQLTKTIRSRLTPVTSSCPCSHSLTKEHSSSRVSRLDREGEEWVRGWEAASSMKLPFGCMRQPYS